MNQVIELLKTFRDMGIDQETVGNYIEVFALKYNDSDEEKWYIACDIMIESLVDVFHHNILWKDK